MPPVLKRTELNHQLKKLGFGGLEDRNLMQQLAFFYTSHDLFRGLLLSTAPEQRRNAYDALRPHLSFTPKPLDVYEMEIKARAEREQWDIWDGSAFPKPFKVPELTLDELASDAIKQASHEKHGGLEVVCAKCTKAQYFKAKLRQDAEKDAKAAGWRSDGKKSWCPEHVPTRMTMTLTCTDCDKVERLRAWDEQDGYQSAKLRGWTIEEFVSCPACSLKRAVIQ